MTVGMGRVHPAHQRDERITIDLAAQAEQLRALTEPQSTRLTRLQVVVRQRLDVVRARVGALQRGHAYGHHTPPNGRVAVHSSIHEVT